MKLKIVTFEDPGDYRTHQKLLKDGKEVYSVYDLSDCPEDATVNRDLLSCGCLVNIIRSFQGEILPDKIEEVTVNTWDEFEKITE